jgi:hypothetical protein
MRKFPSAVRVAPIFALLLITAVIACGSSGEAESSKLVSASKGGTVEAVGGFVTIKVPPGALSEDIEITVSKVENDVSEPSDMPELAAYEFGPDGTTFSKPVQVSLVLPVSLLEDGFRLIHFESDSSDDGEAPLSTPLDVDEIVIDETGENATIKTSISSFSGIKIYRSDFFGLRLTVPNTAVEGVPFPVEAVTMKKSTESQVVRRQVYGSGDDAVVETTRKRTGRYLVMSMEN